MSSDIVSALELDKENTTSRTLVVKEINNCDSSFITSCLLGHFVKLKSAVLIVSTHKSSNHYQNVGLKMNYNLHRNIDSGFIYFYNLGEEFVTKTLQNEYLLPEIIFQNIKENIECILKKHNSVNIIFDGLSHLFNLNYDLKDVNVICSKIIELIRPYNNSLFICHCNIVSENDITNVMASYLSHKAYIVLEVENLASGWSNDVSGHLTIKYPGRKFQNEHMFKMDMKSPQYLFKLFDRGVKLLAPGTV